jgi:predicted alpha/beta superfamily hydrolase
MGKQDYPVIYLLDGEAHFKYVAEMVEFMSSYDRNRMPKAIVIGVVNVDRARDFNPTGSADILKRHHGNIMSASNTSRFLEFIKTELIPYIDKNFKTQPYRILVGHSLAGLFAFYAKLKAPELFQATVLISPAIDGDNDHLLTLFGPFLKRNPQLKGKFFISIANENTGDVERLKGALRAYGPKGVRWSYKQYKDENHFSVTYKSIFDALKFIYASWFFDYYGKSNLSYEDIQTRFAGLSREFGYTIKPTEDFVNNIGYKQLRSGNIDEAIVIFKHNIVNFPNSYNVYDSMGEAYIKKGDKTMAIKYYEKSLQLNPHNEEAKAILRKLKDR